MTRRHLWLAAALGLWAGTAGAADANGSFAVKGVGLTKCSQFVETVKEKNREALAQYIGWLAGYLTANNQHQDETFDLTPWQNLRTITSLMAGYCDKNGELRFVRAAVNLVQALQADRLVDNSELIPIQYEGRDHYVYREAIRRAQARLAELGMYGGDIDGGWNDATRAALETFQKEKEMPVDGLPQQRTLLELFRDEKAGQSQ